MAGKIGMMNEAYFVGKQVLLDWVNTFLDVKMNKVEEMATGALYCQIFDALHPRTVPMSKVDFTCKHDYEYVNNWKVLQTAFKKLSIDKPIPVDRLIKAKYQDNLEFFQWVYSYAHEVYVGDADNPDYDARGRRAKSKGGRDFRGPGASGSGASGIRRRGGGGGGSSSSASASASGAGSSSSSLMTGSRMTRSVTGGGRSSARTAGVSSSSSTMMNNSNVNGNSALLAAKDEQITNLKKKNEELQSFVKVTEERLAQVKAEHADLTVVAKEIESERDFYFQKVLEVERLCKEWPDQSMPLLESIFNELYKSAEDGSFADSEAPPSVSDGDAPMTDASADQHTSAE